MQPDLTNNQNLGMGSKRAQKQENSTGESSVETPQHRRGNLGERGDDEAAVPPVLHIR